MFLSLKNKYIVINKNIPKIIENLNLKKNILNSILSLNKSKINFATKNDINENITKKALSKLHSKLTINEK